MRGAYAYDESVVKSPRGDGQRHMPRPSLVLRGTGWSKRWVDPLQNWGSPDEHLAVPLNISHSTHTRTVATHTYTQDARMHTHTRIRQLSCCLFVFCILYSVEYKSSLTMRWRPPHSHWCCKCGCCKCGQEASTPVKRHVHVRPTASYRIACAPPAFIIEFDQISWQRRCTACRNKDSSCRYLPQNRDCRTSSLDDNRTTPSDQVQVTQLTMNEPHPQKHYTTTNRFWRSQNNGRKT